MTRYIHLDTLKTAISSVLLGIHHSICKRKSNVLAKLRSELLNFVMSLQKIEKL